MVRSLLAASLVLLAFLTGAAPALAQTPRPFRLGVSTGITFLSGEDRDFFRDGFNVQGLVTVNVPKLQIAVRGELTYNSIGGRNRSTQTMPGGPDTLRLGDFSVLGGTVSAVYHVSPPGRPARFYILGGLGVFRTEAEATLYGQPVTGSETDLGLTGGFGLDFQLGGLRLFAETRLHNVFGDGGSGRLYPLIVGVTL